MTLNEYKEKRMQDPDFVEACDEIKPQMDVIRAMIEVKASQEPYPDNRDFDIQK